jgi:hypothetical protein
MNWSSSRLAVLWGALALVACGSAPTEEVNEASIVEEYLTELADLPRTHGAWHRDNTPGLDDYGERFLSMHGHMLMAFDEWRGAHGFEPVPAWDPATRIPADAPHRRRDSDEPAKITHNCVTPAWFTLEGGDAPDPHSGAKRLADFQSLDQLGRSINAPGAPAWHTTVHNAIGGDMGDNSTAPLDPVFWMYHRTVDDVLRTWLELNDQLYPAGSHEIGR